MPQLNPNPWFLILIFSWLVFLTLLPVKVMSHTFPNKLVPETKEKANKTPWNWTW